MKAFKYLTILLATAFACGFLFLSMSKVTDQAPNFIAQTPATPVQLVDVCAENKRLEQELASMIENSGRCETDADCGFVHLSCPLGCFKSVNNTAIPAVKQLHAKYLSTKDECPGCVFRCANSETFRPACDAGQCVVADSVTGEPS